MDKRKNLAVLKAAQAGGFIESIPTSDAERKEQADYWVQEAIKAWESPEGLDNDATNTIKEILNLAGHKLEVKNREALDNFFKSGVFAIEENLPIPREIKHEPKILPIDFTTLTDREVRAFISEYGAFLDRVRWLLGLSNSELTNVSHLRDAAYRRALQAAAEKNEKEDKKKTREVLDAEAKQAGDYKGYDEDVRYAQEKVEAYKSLEKIYEGNVNRLSREITARQNEWERSR